MVEEEIRVWATRSVQILCCFSSDELQLFLCANPPWMLNTSRAVEGHFDHPSGRPWMSITDHINPVLAELVGTRVFFMF